MDGLIIGYWLLLGGFLIIAAVCLINMLRADDPNKGGLKGSWLLMGVGALVMAAGTVFGVIATAVT